MANIPFIDILVLAMIAIFILNKLKNTLGKKTGNEEELSKRYKSSIKSVKESKPDKESFSEIKEKSLHPDPKINTGLVTLKKIEENFELSEFIENSKKAFDFIIKAYSGNNTKSLETLLEKKLYSVYKKDIDRRLKNNESLEITIIGLKEPSILSIKVDRANLAKIDVKYDSEQIHVTKNKKNEIIDGDSNQILKISEKWSFSRKLKSRTPIWTLLEISEI